MKKWLVETADSLWLANGVNAAAAIASVRPVIGDAEAHAAPLPRLKFGRPREIYFPELAEQER